MTLENYMKKNGMTPATMAEAIGVSRPAMHRYLHGRTPETPVVLAIYKATGGAVTPNDLYGITKKRAS